MVRRDGRPSPGIGDRMADLAGEVHDATPEEARGIDLRPLGEDHFNDLTPEQQDETFGPTVAQALRDGHIQLSDLVSKTGDFLTRTPIDELDIPTE